MSPEQARGKPVDRRTDIWAFGCVLFEMLTGRQAFEAGETITDTVAAIIKNDPDWNVLPADTPAHIRALLRRCLQKDSRRRLPHIGVARLEIDEGALADAAAEARVGANAPSGAPRSLPWIVAGVALSIAAVLATMIILRREPVEPGLVRLSLTAREGATLGQNVAQRGTGSPAPHFAPSPDGRRLVYVMYSGDRPPQLWVHSFDALADHALSGTDDAAFPFWSPDSRFIGFFAQGRLKKIETSGGPPQIVCDATAGEGGTWNRDGDIVFAPDETSGLSRVSAAGGLPAPLTTLDAKTVHTSHRWPQFLPDGRHFLYLAMTGAVRPIDSSAIAGRGRMLYVGSMDKSPPTLVMSGVLRAQYAAGRLLFLKDSTLMSQAFDPGSLRISGDPVPVAEQVASNRANGRTAFAASDHVMAYRNGNAAGVGLFAVEWVDRSGKRLETVGSPADYAAIRLAPDGRTLAANIGPASAGANSDLWTLDLRRGGIASRLTLTPDQVEAGLAWSPDGRRIAFAAGENRTELYAKPTSGVGEAEPAVQVGPADADGFVVAGRALSGVQPARRQDRQPHLPAAAVRRSKTSAPSRRRIRQYRCRVLARRAMDCVHLLQKRTGGGLRSAVSAGRPRVARLAGWRPLCAVARRQPGAVLPRADEPIADVGGDQRRRVDGAGATGQIVHRSVGLRSQWRRGTVFGHARRTASPHRRTRERDRICGRADCRRYRLGKREMRGQ